MSGRIWWKLLLSLAVLAAGAYAGVHFLRPVAVIVPVTRGTAYDAVVGSLTVKAERSPTLKSEVSGRIVESNLALAQTVAEGDVLVQLDARAVKLDIASLENEIATLNAQIKAGNERRFDLANLEDDLEYKKLLLERRAIAPVEVERLERQIESLRQRMELDEVAQNQRREDLENRLKSRRLQLEKMTLRAPVDGVVNEILAFPGDLVTANVPIAELVSLQRLVEVQIGEEHIAKIRIGQRATVRLLTYGYDDIFDGTVEKILPAPNTQNQRYTAFLEVDIGREKLTPGITGEALIRIDDRENALLIPRKALIGTNVFVVRNGLVDIRDVEVGFVSLNQAEILSGVEEGEHVILEDLDLFSDGQRVRVEAYEED